MAVFIAHCALGLGGVPRAALKARVALCELFVDGRVDLQPT